MKEKSIVVVFMVKERKSYYFGSVAAIFTVFDSMILDLARLIFNMRGSALWLLIRLSLNVARL
jgi:hypothetical protein